MPKVSLQGTKKRQREVTPAYDDQYFGVSGQESIPVPDIPPARRSKKAKTEGGERDGDQCSLYRKIKEKTPLKKTYICRNLHFPGKQQQLYVVNLAM